MPSNNREKEAAIERLHALYDAGHLSEFWAYLNRLLERAGAMPTQGSASDPLAELAKLEAAAAELLDAMEVCHVCKGLVYLSESPTHCENCSSDCEEHEEPECMSIQRLHSQLRAALQGKMIAADLDAETGTADDRITAGQIAVLRKYLDNMEKQHLRGAAKELTSVSVNALLGLVFPLAVSDGIDEQRFQGWLEVRRRLERLAVLEAPCTCRRMALSEIPGSALNDGCTEGVVLCARCLALNGR